MSKLLLGDCKKVLKDYPDNTFDSVVTDPPYGINFMGKSWDYQVPDVETWKEIFRVLKPGGHLLSFAGTRTQHRMAVNIEDAGFEIRDMIMWCYGSGFPKSHNIGKAVDKLQGNEREDVGYNENSRLNTPDNDVYEAGIRGKETRITQGNSQWEGWGTALKPALEPITMARKPFKWSVAENVLKWGTGGINIDESRIGNEGATKRKTNEKHLGRKDMSDFTRGDFGVDKISKGRFPANLIHDNSEEVRECFPNTKSQQRTGKRDGKETGIMGAFAGQDEVTMGHNDSGSAARYFKSIIYQPKASKKERGASNNHPTVKPVTLMEYLIKMVTPKGGTVLDPFAGSFTTAIACMNIDMDYVCIEKDEENYKIGQKRVKNYSKQLNLF